MKAKVLWFEIYAKPPNAKVQTEVFNFAEVIHFVLEQAKVFHFMVRKGSLRLESRSASLWLEIYTKPPNDKVQTKVFLFVEAFRFVLKQAEVFHFSSQSVSFQ